MRLGVLCVAAVIAGALCTLTTKAAFETSVGGESFAKPFFMELVVGTAMATSLLGSWQHRPRAAAGTVECYLPLLPLAASDLLVGICDCRSVLLAPASLVSLVNCSMLVFSAVATRAILGSRYSRTEWGGILAAAAGVILVGAASLLRGEAAPSGTAPLGVLLALAARALQSAQFAFEERYMKAGRFSPLLQVGAEGAIESALCAALVLPLAHALPGSDHGRVEDVGDTLRSLGRSPTLCALVGVNWLSLAALNPLSMSIGLRHGSVLRVFVEIARPALVWAVELAAWTLSRGRYGEPWAGESCLELGGFGILLLGLALYVRGARERAAAALGGGAAEGLLPGAGRPEHSEAGVPATASG